MKKVDIYIKLIVFSVVKDRLKIYYPGKILSSSELIKNKSLDQVAKQIFQSRLEVSIKYSYLEQLYTFFKSEKEKRVISILYYILIPARRILERDKSNWKSLDEIPKNTQDYDILEYAIQRLRWKIEYTNVVYSLLPREFTFSHLQSCYEAILGKKLDKRNFRKKINSLNILKSTGRKKRSGPARPAEVFSFKKRELEIVEIM